VELPFSRFWKEYAMVPSSALCRAQEELHRQRAAGTTLENVRLISTSAATAWAKEALAAETREARQLRGGAVAHANDKANPAPAMGHDHSVSENPDRGFAHS
jgi:hypothetical protein